MSPNMYLEDVSTGELALIMKQKLDDMSKSVDLERARWKIWVVGEILDIVIERLKNEKSASCHDIYDGRGHYITDKP